MNKSLKHIAKAKTFVVVAAVILLAVVGVSAYVALRPTARERAFTPPKQSHVRQTAADVSTYCSRTSGVLLCQDAAGKTTKYTLPSDVARATSIMPSRDEKRFLVITANNPLHSTPAYRVLVTDTAFKTVRELPGTEVSKSSGFTWAASDQSIIYARQSKDPKKNDLIAFDVDSGTMQTITQQPTSGTLPYTSADGKSVFMSASTQGKSFELLSIDTRDGSVHQANTDDVTKHLTEFANYTYDPASNQLYAIGATKSGPVLVTTTINDGVVTVKNTVSDGGAYTPLSLAHSGMLFMRTKDGKVTYGTISTDGTFAAVKYTPSRAATFGLSTSPSLAASPSASLAAADFQYSYVASPPKGITDFVSDLVKPGSSCDDLPFNQTDLLATANNNKQFSVLLAPCAPGSPSQLQFYAQNGNTYSLALATTTEPTCQQLDAAKLAHELAPECVVHADGTDAGSAKGMTPDATNGTLSGLSPELEQKINHTTTAPSLNSSGSGSTSLGIDTTNAVRPMSSETKLLQ